MLPIPVNENDVIHKGEQPIVPGLCMAAWLKRELALTELDCASASLLLFTQATSCVSTGRRVSLLLMWEQ